MYLNGLFDPDSREGEVVSEVHINVSLSQLNHNCLHFNAFRPAFPLGRGYQLKGKVLLAFKNGQNHSTATPSSIELEPEERYSKRFTFAIILPPLAE